MLTTLSFASSLTLCVHLLLSTVGTNAYIGRHFSLSPKDTEVAKRLHGGFHYELVGTANMPVGFFDAVYQESTTSATGRMRSLPWGRLYFNDYLFNPSYMSVRKLPIDASLEPRSTKPATRINSRVLFLLFSFSARFIETFRQYERSLNAGKVRKASSKEDNEPSINLDLLTEMYNRAYCEAFEYLNSINFDLFNRCPHPCRSGKALAKSSNCQSSKRDCNPCLGDVGEVQTRMCKSDSRVWLKDFVCKCSSGYTWDKDSHTCRVVTDLMGMLMVRQNLQISIDSLHLFMDSRLPELIVGFQTVEAGYKEFPINPDASFHPFGHESLSTLKTARRLTVNLSVNGAAKLASSMSVTALLPNEVIVEKIHATYTLSNCTLTLRPTRRFYKNFATLPSSVQTMEVCYSTCMLDTSCTYLVLVVHDIVGLQVVRCMVYKDANVPFIEDGSERIRTLFGDTDRCSRSGILCWAMHKTCGYYPPRIALSENSNRSTISLIEDPQLREVLSTDVCVTNDEMQNIYKVTSSHGMLNSGDYTECLIYCERLCATVFFLSTKSCQCSIDLVLNAVSSGGQWCGVPCEHRTDWSCGSQTLFKAFVLQSTHGCRERNRVPVVCAALLDSMYGDDTRDVDMQKILPWDTDSPGTRTTWASISATPLKGPYFLGTKPRFGNIDDQFHNDGSYFEAGLMKIRLEDAKWRNVFLGCQTFCQSSCMPVFGLAPLYCFCATSGDKLINPRKTGNCNNTKSGLTSQLIIGLDKGSVALYDLGNINTTSCTVYSTSDNLTHGFEPRFWNPPYSQLHNINTYKMIEYLHFGCYATNEQVFKKSERNFSKNAEECVLSCSRSCKAFSYFALGLCYCSDESPTDGKQFFELYGREDFCGARSSISLSEHSQRTMPQTTERMPFRSTTSAFSHTAGYGSAFKVEFNESLLAEKTKVRYLGCRKFIAAYYDTSTTVLFERNIFDASDLQNHHACLTKCKNHFCPSRNDCNFFFIICGPGHCGKDAFCLCLQNIAIYHLWRVPSSYCIEDASSLSRPVSMLTASSINEAAITDKSRLSNIKREFELQKHLLITRARTVFTREGGRRFNLSDKQSAFNVYKNPLYQYCVLHKGKLERVVSKAITGRSDQNCYRMMSSILSNPTVKFLIVPTHASCIDTCRHECFKYYTFADIYRRGVKCICMKDLNNLVEMNSTHGCEQNSIKCSTNEKYKECGSSGYSYVYALNSHLNCPTTLCHPSFMRQPGFFNLSLLYSCTKVIEHMRRVTVLQSNIAPSESNMTGLFGLTKIDMHSGSTEVPILTSNVKSSLKYQLTGLLSGKFDSGISLEAENQARARYAYWDTEMRTVFYRTFNRSVNNCRLDRSVGVTVRLVNDSVKCECRTDYHGLRCTHHRNGCQLSKNVDNAIQVGDAACNSRAKLWTSSRSVCHDTAGNDPPVKPYLDYTCTCGGNFQRDPTVPFDNCFRVVRACENRDCGSGTCTNILGEFSGWRCLCKTGVVQDQHGVCTQQNIIYMVTSWSDWSSCQPECGPMRYRTSSRQCLIDNCTTASPDNEMTRRRVCRARACVRHLGQRSLDIYEELAGDTLDLASGTVALLCVCLSTSAACGLVLAIIWIISPFMGRRVLEESLWFFLVCRNRVNRIFQLPLELLHLFRRRPDTGGERSAEKKVNEKEKKGEKEKEKTEKKKVEKKKKKKKTEKKKREKKKREKKTN